MQKGYNNQCSDLRGLYLQHPGTRNVRPIHGIKDNNDENGDSHDHYEEDHQNGSLGFQKPLMLGDILVAIPRCLCGGNVQATIPSQYQALEVSKSSGNNGWGCNNGWGDGVSLLIMLLLVEY